jgi:hypothetical protein
MSDMFEATGLWINTTKDGESYMSGSMGNLKINVFRNKYKKEGDRQPDYRLCVSEREKKQEAQQPQASVPDTSPISDRDIPF